MQNTVEKTLKRKQNDGAGQKKSTEAKRIALDTVLKKNSLLLLEGVLLVLRGVLPIYLQSKG